jgi:hypothetical protein
VQGQSALSFRGRVAVEFRELARERSRRVLFHLEDFVGLGVFVQFRHAKVHRTHIHGHVDGTGLRGLVVHDFSGTAGEFAAPYGQTTHVVRFKAGVGVRRIENVGDRRCEPARADQRGHRRQNNTVH